MSLPKYARALRRAFDPLIGYMAVTVGSEESDYGRSTKQLRPDRDLSRTFIVAMSNAVRDNQSKTNVTKLVAP